MACQNLSFSKCQTIRGHLLLTTPSSEYPPLVPSPSIVMSDSVLKSLSASVTQQQSFSADCELAMMDSLSLDPVPSLHSPTFILA